MPVRYEVWDTGERKQESVSSDRLPKAASEPCSRLAPAAPGLLFAIPEQAWHTPKNSVSCWILLSFSLPHLEMRKTLSYCLSQVLYTILTLTIYALEIRKADGTGKK